MSFCRKSLLLLLGLVASISVAPGIDKDKKFTPPALSSIKSQITNNGVTVAAVPYNTEELAKSAFGKVNPYEHGVLPVLVIIQNDNKQAIQIGKMQVEYIDRDRSRIENTPGSEVQYLKAPKRPNMNPSPIPGLGRGKKNPLAAEEIEMRGWAAKMLPPGESAHGFFYFRTGHRPGAKLYLTGMEEAASGKELFYFEVPLN
jgi:hypothetical protein